MRSITERATAAAEDLCATGRARTDRRRAGCAAAALTARGLGLALSVAGVAAAAAFLRASLAAFLAIFEILRAFLSSAFAALTRCFASSARWDAFSASVASRM